MKILDSEIHIVAATRTPIGRLGGILSHFTAPQLGQFAIRGALAQAAITPNRVTDLVMGHVLQAGIGQATARQAALDAGLPESVRCATVSKVCGSGMEAVILGVRSLALGDSKLVVAGGMESMSNAPYLLGGARQGWRLGNQQAVDSVIHDGLWDSFNNIHMGSCADACARNFGVTREQQDAFASESYRRANIAQSLGLFREEISSVEHFDKARKLVSIQNDEGPARVDYDKIPRLKPAFSESGTVTAANASSINDGAAVLVLKNAANGVTSDLKPLARIVSYASHSQDPMQFLTSPIGAAKGALQMARWNVLEVDLWEINEAFAIVPLLMEREMGIAKDRINVRGGAIALGHPIGASGARILVTLLAALRERGGRRGIAAICIGGGEGLAMAVELLPS